MIEKVAVGEKCLVYRKVYDLKVDEYGEDIVSTIQLFYATLIKVEKNHIRQTYATCTFEVEYSTDKDITNFLRISEAEITKISTNVLDLDEFAKLKTYQIN